MNPFLLAKPTKVFPLFSRATPSVTTQPPPEDDTPAYTSSQPIDSTRSDEPSLQTLETSKPPPAKFRPKKWKSAPSDNCKSNGHSPDDPIVLDISPTRTKSLPTKTNFGSRAPFKLKKKKGFGYLDPPLPSGETQHIRGLQTTFKSNNVDIPFKRRTRGPIASTDTGRPSTLSLAEIISHPQDSPVHSNQCPTPLPPPPPSEIPPEYQVQHPVFKIFSEPSEPSDAKLPTTDLWVNKWAPRQALHVLGNEVHAFYLRDWLKASAINSFSGPTDPPATSTPASSSQPGKKPPQKRGTKRMKIRREVGGGKPKKRRRGEDDSIIDDPELPSDSSELEPHPLDAYLKDSPSLYVPDKSLPGAEAPKIDIPEPIYYTPTAFDMRNTIVLYGPSGSGKSAAVYACAKELDWEVFEVYPGIGKRSAAGLDNLIGQVGRNHLVTKQGGRLLSPVLEKENALTRFLGVSRGQVPSAPGSVGGSSEGTDVLDIGAIDLASDDGLGVPVPPRQDGPPLAVESVQKSQAQAKQSLILLEEVDILYGDDVNFWPTVINIIRDCRRPVVMTCNGA